MAAKRRTSRDKLLSDSLVKRLEAQILKLKQIKVDDERAMSILQAAIDELKLDAKVLKVIAPHVFVFVPRK